MTLADLGNLGEFIGAMAVVVSLLYLAVQIRQNTIQTEQNTRSVRMSAFQELLNHVASINGQVVANQDVAKLLLLGQDEEMEPVDRIRLLTFNLTGFRAQQQAFLLHKDGFITEEQWRSFSGGLRRTLEGGSVRRHWATLRGEFVEEFRDFVDQLARAAGASEARPRASPATLATPRIDSC